MGFTCVRLPFSNQMLKEPGVPAGAISYHLNPELKGKTPLEVCFCRPPPHLGDERTLCRAFQRFFLGGGIKHTR